MPVAEQSPASAPAASDLTPRQIVEALDRNIVGQGEAKRVVAIALRNRARRRRLPAEMREEIAPKNIIMIGPTGVGKTEIARRLAKLVSAPFLKVEATKYTEVGYVGRDVESMIRDLVETSIKIVRERETEQIRAEGERRARERLLELLAQRERRASGQRRMVAGYGEAAAATIEVEPETESERRADLERRYDQGELEEHEVEIEVAAKSQLDGMIGMIGVDEGAMGQVRDMMDRLMPPRAKKSKLKVADARRIISDQEVERLLDMDKITREAIDLAEQSGIVFIDEIDKIAGRGNASGPDVSRQGVQRDILPIVEGCTVATKHGLVRTDHILFIAAGAFHMTKPSDLIPELQGRFPLRVELNSLGTEDFERILTEPRLSLTEQYEALLGTDGVELKFAPDGVRALAECASAINSQTEDIGARRLHTILERVLQEVAFDAPDAASGEIVIDAAYVKAKLSELMKDQDLSRFIL